MAPGRIYDQRPTGACDRRMGFMAQTLGPRTGPAGASTVSEKSAARFHLLLLWRFDHATV